MRIQSVLNPLPLRRRELENQKRPSYPRACQSKRSNSSSRRRRLGWLATLGYRLEKPPPLPATWPLHEEYRLNPLRPSPVSPTVSSQQAGARMTEGPSKLKTGESRLRGTQAHNLRDRPSGVSASKQPWSPPVTSPTGITTQQFVPPEAVESSRQKSKTAPSEEPFQRFYSTFEGLISKISAPLAFAGLPLGTEASTQSDSARRKSSAADTKVDRHQATSDRLGQFTEPDVSRIFSRAALRAIRDSNGNGAGNTAESFYVVPTTGGTVSYAGILTRAEKEARRNSLDEADDDFVDARETPASPELRQSLTGSRGRASRAADKLTTPA
ncbi:hypothetical protein V6Z98_010119 [Aspergillus fumigatus]